MKLLLKVEKLDHPSKSSGVERRLLLFERGDAKQQVSLAVADTITLLSSVPQEVLSYHILGDQVFR